MTDKGKTEKGTPKGATELKEDQLDKTSGGLSESNDMINWAKAPPPGAAKIQDKKMGGP